MKQVVRAFLKNSKWQYLLVKHKGKDYWTLPWWHVEEWETIYKAIKREIKEELNLEIKIHWNTLWLDIENIKEKPSPICTYKIEFEKENWKKIKKTEFIFLASIKDESKKIKVQEKEIDDYILLSSKEILLLDNTFYQIKEIIKKMPTC